MPTRNALVLALLAAFAAGAASAQTALRAGQTVSGTLSADSPRADDGTPYALYTFRGRAGDRIRVDMQSSDFDAYLAVGSVAAPGCPGDCRTDDDGGEHLNSRLTYVLPDSGQVQIRANSVGGDATGTFTLQVTELPPQARPTTRPVQFGQAATGSFDDDTATDDDERPYALYSFAGRADQGVVVRVDSEDFDPLVEFGRMEGGSFVSEASDDDGGSGLNARLSTRVGASGNAMIKVTSPSTSARGAYTVLVSDPPRPQPITVADLSVGESVRGRLDDSDPFDAEEIRFDVYRIQGNPGQRVVVRMESPDLDPLLKWGTFDGDRFSEEARDDDGGGGNSALLNITLDADGDGRLVATSYGGGEGGYTVSVVSAPRGGN